MIYYSDKYQESRINSVLEFLNIELGMNNVNIKEINTASDLIDLVQSTEADVEQSNILLERAGQVIQARQSTQEKPLNF